jgi:uncharacterized membrane protein YhaH (DUF805 family)
MAIEFRCPSCRGLLRVPDEAAGREAQCPQCGRTSAVPAAAASGPLAPAGPPADAEEVNPFQSPLQSGGPASTPQGLENAARRVAAPATTLIVIGSLTAFANLAMAVLCAVFAMGRWRGPQAQFLLLPMAMVVAYFLFVALLDTIVILGGISMRNLRNYGLSIAAALITIIPFSYPCCMAWTFLFWVLGLPFGIWALAVLCQGDVKAAFGRSATAGGAEPLVPDDLPR